MKKPLAVTFYKDRRGLWRWRIQSSNGKVIADSAEGYDRFGGAEHGLNLIVDHIEGAKIVKNDGKKITVLHDPDAVVTSYALAP